MAVFALDLVTMTGMGRAQYQGTQRASQLHFSLQVDGVECASDRSLLSFGTDDTHWASASCVIELGPGSHEIVAEDVDRNVAAGLLMNNRLTRLQIATISFPQP